MPFKGFLQFLWKMHSHLIVSNIAILSDTGFTKRQTRRPLAYMLWCTGLGNRPRNKWSLFKGCKLPFKKPRVSQPDLETLAPVKFWELCVLFSLYTPCYTLITFALTCFLVRLKHCHLTVVYVWQVGTDTLVSLIIKIKKNNVSEQGCQWTPCELWWDTTALTKCQYLQFLGMPRNFSEYESSLWICESLLISFIKYQIEFLSVGIAFIQWEHYQGGWFVSQSLMDILLGNLQKRADIMMFIQSWPIRDY